MNIHKLLFLKMEGKIIYRKEVIDPIIGELLKNGYYIVDPSSADIEIIGAYLEEMMKNGNIERDRTPDKDGIIGRKYDLTNLGREFLSK